MSIELCLFDLDNTLLDTRDLEPFRGRENVGVTSAMYTQKMLKAAFGAEARQRYLYNPEELIALRGQFPKMRWGVFTRSPRHYAATLLTRAFPDFKWDIIIGREDVEKTKPDPEGIWIAGVETGVESLHHIALVGDEKVDVVCAYRAGCWSFIDQTSWEPRCNEHWWALERVPDAVFKGSDELASLLSEPYLRVPDLEYLIFNQRLNGRARRIDKINHFFPRSIGNGYVPIYVMGRIFGDYKELSPRRDWHSLTEQIHAYKSATTFPESWVQSIHNFISAESIFSQDVVLTVIPFKPGRTPRLEALLRQVATTYGPSKKKFRKTNIEFLEDVMAFRDGAVSSHGHHLTAEERFQNVGKNLYVKRPRDIEGKHVIVIDDVVTSGATLLWADRYLMLASARKVSCMSLTKAIGPN